MVLLIHFGGNEYARMRRTQLSEARFALWVYRVGNNYDCLEEHADLNGLVLPPEHAFWEDYMPPNAFGCSCYVSGARSLRAAQRLGGSEEKELPDGWKDGAFVDPAYRRNNIPKLEQIVEMLIAGHFD